MILFLMASLPLFFFFVVLLPWDSELAPRALTLVDTFLKGVLLYVPGFLVMLVARRIFGFSYNGILLFLSLLLRDHLVPLLLGMGAFLLAQKRLDVRGTDEGIFLAVFSFLAGFLSMANITDLIAEWGTWDAHALFLLPALRIATVLLVSLAAQRFFRWEGKDGAAFCGAGAALAAILSVSSFFFRINRPGWSALFAALPFAASVALFAMRFPRAVRG